MPWDTSDRDAVRARARGLNVAGWQALGAEPREAEIARGHFAEGLLLFRQLDDQIGIANSLRGYGVACMALGDAETNRRHSEESLAICRAVGDRHGQVWSMFTLAGSAQAERRLDEAAGYLAEAVKGFRDLETPFHACEALRQLGDLYRCQGKLALALDSYRELLEEQRRHRFTTLGDQVLHGLAQLAAQLHRFGLAARLTGAATTWSELYGRAPSYGQSDTTAARRHLGEPDWNRLYAVGACLNPEQAMQLADEALDDLAEALATELAGLTEREVEVLRLVALGLSNAEIAERLVLSPRTVHAHLRSVFDKLGVTTRTAAARHAVRLGLAPE